MVDKNSLNNNNNNNSEPDNSVPAEPLFLPDYILNPTIKFYLNTKDISRLSLTCKHTHHLFKDDLDVMQATILLELIAHGEQNKAEAYIKKYPYLLFKKGKVSDYSGRMFEDISAFQLALWCLDSHMWRMLLKYLPTEEARNQIYEFVHGDAKFKTIHDDYYDLFPLIFALTEYQKNKFSWSEEKKVDYWCHTVGPLQCNVPVHVANEYCKLQGNFGADHDFDDDELVRTLVLYDNTRKKHTSWFPLSESKIGTNIAVFRGQARMAYADSYPVWDLNNEIVGLFNLAKTRMREFEELQSQLLTPSSGCNLD